MTVLGRLSFFFGDLFFLNLAVALSFAFVKHQSNLSDQVYLFIFSNLTWIYLTLVANPYNINKSWSLSKIIKTQMAFLIIHLLVVGALIFFLKKTYGSIQILLVYLLFIPVFFAWKVIIYYIKKILTVDITYRNYILIGRNALAEDIRRYYYSNSELGYKFIGYMNFSSGDELINEIRDINSKQEIHEIFCCAIEIDNSSLKPLIDFGLNSLIKVRVVTGSSGDQTIQLDRNDFELKPSISVISLDETRNRLIKRIFDLILSILFMITILSWFLPIIGLLIKLDSKGPVFFIQKRNGEGNKPFGCIKFRTMFVNKEADIKQATRNDSRITRMGKFLRKSSIDELPQFINVLLGDMSLIGPRPHPIKLNEQFEPLISNMMSRHYVKPGITGLAQCMGYRGETQTLADMENRVRLDRYYIENWTFWLDIKIIFLTVISLIRGSDKAY